MLRVLGKAGTLTVDQIGAELNYGRGALEKALRLLEVDGAVEHDKRSYTPHGQSVAAGRGALRAGHPAPARGAGGNQALRRAQRAA